MMRQTLMAAVLTGLFCMGFSVVVGWLSMTLSMLALVALSFVSGFCGSLFARLVLKGDGR